MTEHLFGVEGRREYDLLRRIADLETRSTPMTDHREQLLADASELVTGDRAKVYGPPSANFARIAALHACYLGLLPAGHVLTTQDVAIMAMLTKVARLIQTPDHRDSWVDLAGYAAAGYDAVREVAA
jgi:hypothetical protein